ncbi:MAG: hypothetical protein JKY65_10485 [Planctomycetes bacterium]|nr:hypothetical protein [Planctomycetota bacterium]
MKVHIIAVAICSTFLLGCPSEKSAGDGHAHGAETHGSDDGHGHAAEKTDKKTDTKKTDTKKTDEHKSGDGHDH